MKNLLYIVIVLASVCANAQVAIAKTDVDGAGLLDFREGDDNGNDFFRGLILPKVETLDSNTVQGTMYFNASNGRLEYIDKYANIIALTNSTTTAPNPIDGPAADTGTGVLITDGSDVTQESAPGVLVLASANKSLILPKVANPESTIVNPQEGMIVYDTTSKSMAVYNGEKWSFWN